MGVDGAWENFHKHPLTYTRKLFSLVVTGLVIGVDGMGYAICSVCTIDFIVACVYVMCENARQWRPSTFVVGRHDV